MHSKTSCGDQNGWALVFDWILTGRIICSFSCCLPGWCPGKPTLVRPPAFFLFCLTPHWDPAPTLMLLSGACPFHFSVETKWPELTYPTLTEEETKHRHNILHVCMAHRESLPSHLCGLISLSFSLPFCVFLFTHSVAAWKCSTCGESLSPVHMLGEWTRLGWDWQSQTKCLRNTEWLSCATLCHNYQTGKLDPKGGDGAGLYLGINLFFLFKPASSLPPLVKIIFHNIQNYLFLAEFFPKLIWPDVIR